MEPRVLVGCPTADYKAYCLDEYLKALKKLTYKNCDFLIVDNSKTNEYAERIKKAGFKVIKDVCLPLAKERIVHSRNLIKKYMVDNNYDYFLSLEQDVIPPEDVIERLLEAGKEIITGIYYSEYKMHGKPIIRPLIWKQVKDKPDMIEFMTKEAESNEVVEVDVCGLGCILISKKALEKIEFRVEEDKGTFDDVFFCMDAKKNGFKIYADTSLKCKHLIKGMEWDKIENEENSRKKD